MKHIAKRADPREAPAYNLAEAARYLKLPPATLSAWVHGRGYPTTRGSRRSRPLIEPATRKPTLLCFWNLIEAHVLRSLRAVHGVSAKALRDAIDYAENELGLERLLLSTDLRAEAGQLFLDRFGKLIHLSRSGQLVMRQAFEAHLQRIEWDDVKFPVRLYPFVSTDMPSGDRPIVIDSRLSFGRPVVISRGISTSTIAERVDAGETVEFLAGDYNLSVLEVEQAIRYERAA